MTKTMNRIRQLGWSIYGRIAWDRNRNEKIVGLICNKIVTTMTVNKKGQSERVLDVGCGTGYYASEIAKAGFAVTGIDYAKGMIDKARSKYKLDESLEFEQVDISKTTLLKENSFDYAISISSLQAVPDPVFTLKEIKRLVKPQGLIIIVHASRPDFHQVPLRQQVNDYFANSPNTNVLDRFMYYIKSYVERKGFSTYWTLPALQSKIDECGLEIIKIDEINSIKIITTKATNP
jgi:ubiquinone/menaquinone biosynthesis C-methylase UbiE